MIRAFRLLSLLILVAAASVCRASTYWDGGTVSELQTLLMKTAQGNRQLQNHVVENLIGGRCAYNLGSRYQSECVRAGFLVIKTLKARPVTFEHPSSGVRMTLPSVFVYDLVAILEDPRAQIFFSNWKNAVQMAALGVQEANLYDTILALLGGDQNEAIRWMGALFQDVSYARVQIQWLKANLKEPSDTLIAAVKAYEELILQLIDIDAGRYRTISGVKRFPPFIEALPRASHTGRLYHFYVPALLASRLRAQGVSAPVSAFSAYMLTYIYEAMGMGNPIARILTEPKSLSTNAARDSYAAYRAALWASGLDTRAMSPTEYASKVAASPSSGLAEIARRLTAD